MKDLLLRFAVAVLLGAALGLGILVIAWPGGKPNPAPLSFDRHDVRSPQILDEPIELVHEFTVHNPTTQTVHLKKVNCGCACREPTLGTSVLGPGESTTLTMRLPYYFPQPGSIKYLCTIDTDYEAHRLWRFEVEVPCYPAFSIEPSQLHIATLAPGQTVTREVRVDRYHLANDNPALPQLRAEEPLDLRMCHGATTEQLDNGVLRTTTTYEIKLRGGTRPGDFTSKLFLDAVAASYGAKTAMVYWRVEGPISTEPSFEAFFGKVKRTDRPISKKVVLKSSDGSFRILSIRPRPELETAIPSAVKLELPTGRAADEHILQATLDPSKLEKTFSVELQVSLDHKVQKEVNLRLAAMLSD